MQLKNGQYHIQGISPQDLMAEFGSPLYVYDAQVIAEQVQKLKNAFSSVPLRIKYASKALTNQSILKLMKRLGCEVDTVSLEEIEVAFQAGFTEKEILFTPNSISFKELQKAIAKGVFINIDNLSVLEEFGQEYGHSIPCCIRINPHIEAGGNDKIKTGHKESKFGISIDQLEDIAFVVEKYNIYVTGLHVHTGSDFSDIDVFMQGAKVMFEAAMKFSELEFMDFGSGFKVAYKKGDKVTDIALLGHTLSDAFLKFCDRYGKKLELWFEPGKFLVSDAGTLLVTASVLKETPATTFVGIDSGLNHLIRPMMYGAYHEIINVSNAQGTLKNYSVVGYICETDTFAWDRPINEVKANDILAILNAGAYGFSMSSNYNARPRPAEVMVYEGKAHLIRRRETLQDVLSTQVEMSF